MCHSILHTQALVSITIDEIEQVSPYFKKPEPILNKFDANQREPSYDYV